MHRTELDSAPVTAPLPPCLQERGLAAPGLPAHVLISKYCDHLPHMTNRQIPELTPEAWAKARRQLKRAS